MLLVVSCQRDTYYSLNITSTLGLKWDVMQIISNFYNFLKSCVKHIRKRKQTVCAVIWRLNFFAWFNHFQQLEGRSTKQQNEECKPIRGLIAYNNKKKKKKWSYCNEADNISAHFQKGGKRKEENHMWLKGNQKSFLFFNIFIMWPDSHMWVVPVFSL